LVSTEQYTQQKLSLISLRLQKRIWKPLGLTEPFYPSPIGMLVRVKKEVVHQCTH